MPLTPERTLTPSGLPTLTPRGTDGRRCVFDPRNATPTALGASGAAAAILCVGVWCDPPPRDVTPPTTTQTLVVYSTQQGYAIHTAGLHDTGGGQYILYARCVIVTRSYIDGGTRSRGWGDLTSKKRTLRATIWTHVVYIRVGKTRARRHPGPQNHRGTSAGQTPTRPVRARLDLHRGRRADRLNRTGPSAPCARLRARPCPPLRSRHRPSQGRHDGPDTARAHQRSGGRRPQPREDRHHGCVGIDGVGSLGWVSRQPQDESGHGLPRGPRGRQADGRPRREGGPPRQLSGGVLQRPATGRRGHHGEHGVRPWYGARSDAVLDGVWH